MGASLLFLILLAAKPAATPEALFKSAIEDFEFGEHAAAAEKLRSILEPPQLTSKEDLIVARQYLGACYHLLDDKEKAKAQFSLLLALDSKHKLDPEVFSPALVEFFEDLRREAGLPAEGGVTQIEAPKKKKEREVAQTEVKTDLEPKPASSPPPALLGLIPFGVGQFSNRHPVRGVMFATAEVGLFATSVITFAMFEGLKLPQNMCGTQSACFRPEDEDSARTLQSAYLITFWSGVAVAGIGIVEALISYPGDSVSTAHVSSSSSRSFAFSPNGLTIEF